MPLYQHKTLIGLNRKIRFIELKLASDKAKVQLMKTDKPLTEMGFYHNDKDSVIPIWERCITMYEADLIEYKKQRNKFTPNPL